MTGGLGFIGSHVVDALVADGHEVVVLDRARVEVDRWPPSAVEVVAGDVRDLDVVRGAVRGCDAVSHQAARVGLGVDFTDVTDYVGHNDLGTAVLLRALHDAGFRGRIVLASSMVVYGEGRYRCTEHGSVRPGVRRPEDLAASRYEPPCPECARPLAPDTISEDAPLDPRNVYAATKLHQEHLAQAFAIEHPAVAVTALRYHNVYGPRMPRDTPYAGVASIFLSALARGEAPKVLEDGQQRRDFVHVRDVARANVLALTAPEPVRGACNVASGEPHTVLDLARALAAAAGADAPTPEVVGGWRPGDVRHVVASPQRARDRLGFAAEIAFAEGVRELAATLLAGRA